MKAIPAIDCNNIVRGQFKGYRNEKGVAADSQVETFAALRLDIDSWRWKGVPFYIRAGKCLPVTCAEVVLRMRQPPTMYEQFSLSPNTFRLRISPDMALAFGMNIMAIEKSNISHYTEMIASSYPQANDMDAYERLLGDAMAGDSTLFAREDYVEEAWRIVEQILKKPCPVHEYEPNTWGPKRLKQLRLREGGTTRSLRLTRIDSLLSKFLVLRCFLWIVSELGDGRDSQFELTGLVVGGGSYPTNMYASVQQPADTERGTAF